MVFRERPRASHWQVGRLPPASGSCPLLAPHPAPGPAHLGVEEQRGRPQELLLQDAHGVRHLPLLHPAGRQRPGYVPPGPAGSRLRPLVTGAGGGLVMVALLPWSQVTESHQCAALPAEARLPPSRAPIASPALGPPSLPSAPHPSWGARDCANADCGPGTFPGGPHTPCTSPAPSTLSGSLGLSQQNMETQEAAPTPRLPCPCPLAPGTLPGWRVTSGLCPGGGSGPPHVARQLPLGPWWPNAGDTCHHRAGAGGGRGVARSPSPLRSPDVPPHPGPPCPGALSFPSSACLSFPLGLGFNLNRGNLFTADTAPLTEPRASGPAWLLRGLAPSLLHVIVSSRAQRDAGHSRTGTTRRGGRHRRRQSCPKPRGGAPPWEPTESRRPGRALGGPLGGQNNPWAWPCGGAWAPRWAVPALPSQATLGWDHGEEGWVWLHPFCLHADWAPWWALEGRAGGWPSPLAGTRLTGASPCSSAGVTSLNSDPRPCWPLGSEQQAHGPLGWPHGPCSLTRVHACTCMGTCVCTCLPPRGRACFSCTASARCLHLGSLLPCPCSASPGAQPLLGLSQAPWGSGGVRPAHLTNPRSKANRHRGGRGGPSLGGWPSEGHAFVPA